jgi:hypothetical protein
VDGDFEFENVFSLTDSELNLQFDWTKPGCFVAMGAQAFVVLVRELDYKYTQLAKIEPTYLSKLGNGSAPLVAVNAVNSGPYVGMSLSSQFIAQELNVRAFHDGRSIWVVDMQYSTCRRVVAPGR